MKTPVVISLFDFTGEAVRPWAEAGYACYCYDLQHPDRQPRTEFIGKGSITFWHWDSTWGIKGIALCHLGEDVRMVFGFSPCTDLASLGAKHWERKRQADPDFQLKAVEMARQAEALAGHLGCPFVSENPVGALSTLWRKADYTFHPCDFGGYIPEDEAAHPIWPEYIPPRDAYTKRTCLWTSKDFVMPVPIPVEPIVVELRRKDGSIVRGSPQWAKLGGKSLKTKNIRSATPRGFARAVFNANAGTAATRRLAA